METTQSWTVAGGTTDGVTDAILRSLAAAGWRDLTRQDGSVQARFGSRLAFRLFGAYLAPGRDRFPMRLTVSVGELATGTVVAARLSSDEGFYLARIPAMTRLFERNSADLFAALETGTRAA
ncbi:hypothetical protein DPM19_07450 [Actinomadura craniellae]|uniref:Uncharacterized protein n=1 Tax=Actinomadura craniellae TaxID=2231787 RepID=A0A365H966_9ACTN|nr:hypothetical protein [Actinomadura craniellae]RAY15621.1 hypothetical protein DPM19_07450 [Actinomadura craniellae]